MHLGMIVRTTEHTLEPSPSSTLRTAVDSDEEDEEKAEPVRVLENVSDIKQVIVWDHDQQPAADDPFRKGVEEWLSFADAIHNSGPQRP